jgi:hypothetical protein
MVSPKYEFILFIFSYQNISFYIEKKIKAFSRPHCKYVNIKQFLWHHGVRTFLLVLANGFTAGREKLLYKFLSKN